MSRTLLHNWECSIERNTNNTEELLKIAEDIYNTAYARGKASEERTQGEWNYIQAGMCVCPFCGAMPHKLYKNYCANCGADMRGDEQCAEK